MFSALLNRCCCLLKLAEEEKNEIVEGNEEGKSMMKEGLRDICQAQQLISVNRLAGESITVANFGRQ